MNKCIEREQQLKKDLRHEESSLNKGFASRGEHESSLTTSRGEQLKYRYINIDISI